MFGDLGALALVLLGGIVLASCTIEDRSLEEGSVGGEPGTEAGGKAGGGASPGIGGGSVATPGGASGATNGGATNGGGVSGATGGGQGSGASGGVGGATSGGAGGVGGGVGGATSGGGASLESCSSVEAQFSSGLDGWSVLYAEPEYLAAGSQLTWSAEGAKPGGGALELLIPFSSPGQKLEAGLGVPAADLSGKVLTAWVKLESGLTSDPSNPGGAKLYVKSGPTFAYADSGWRNLGQAWTKLELRVDAPGGFVQPGYSGTSIREVGVEIATGANGKQYQPASVSFDDIACSP